MRLCPCSTMSISLLTASMSFLTLSNTSSVTVIYISLHTGNLSPMLFLLSFLSSPFIRHYIKVTNKAYISPSVFKYEPKTANSIY